MQLLQFITIVGTFALTLGCGKPETFTDFSARVVSLHDTTTELVVALGVEDQLVAISSSNNLSDRARNATSNIARLPEGPVSPEAFVLLRPTIVLGTDVIEERQPNLRPSLERVGIEVRWIDLQGFAGLLETTTELGALLQASEAATKLAQEFIARLDTLSTHAPDTGQDPVRVFFYDCCDPPFTTGGRAPMSELLERIGARNIFADLDQDWSVVSWEAVLQQNPELIVVHDYSWGDQASIDAKLDSLNARSFLRNLPAIRSKRLVAMPLGLALEGPRNLDALDWLLPAVNDAFNARSEVIR